MKFLRIGIWFVVGCLLAFAIKYSLSSPGAGQDRPTGLVSSGNTSFGSNGYVPFPVPPRTDEGLVLAYQVGNRFGSSLATDFVTDPSHAGIAEILAQNRLRDDLIPLALKPNGDESADWLRVGVVSGVVFRIESAGPAGRSPRTFLLQEEILDRVIHHGQEIRNPIIRASLLMALESNFESLRANGQTSERSQELCEQITEQVVVAVNQSIDERWWETIWSSSLWAAVGGFFLAFCGVAVEKVSGKLLSRSS